MGINPDKKKMVVLVSAAKSKNAIRVQDAEDNTFFVQSKVLLDGIRTVAPQIGAQDSCLLYGTPLKERKAVAFDMNDIEAMPEME